MNDEFNLQHALDVMSLDGKLIIANTDHMAMIVEFLILHDTKVIITPTSDSKYRIVKG